MDNKDTNTNYNNNIESDDVINTGDKNPKSPNGNTSANIPHCDNTSVLFNDIQEEEPSPPINDNAIVTNEDISNRNAPPDSTVNKTLDVSTRKDSQGEDSEVQGQCNLLPRSLTAGEGGFLLDPAFEGIELTYV